MTNVSPTKISATRSTSTVVGATVVVAGASVVSEPPPTSTLKKRDCGLPSASTMYLAMQVPDALPTTSPPYFPPSTQAEPSPSVKKGPDRSKESLLTRANQSISLIVRDSPTSIPTTRSKSAAAIGASVAAENTVRRRTPRKNLERNFIPLY